MCSYERLLLDFLDSEQKKLIRFAQALVRTRTVNPPGEEAELAALVARQLEDFGIPSHIMDHGDGRASVVGVLAGAGDAGDLMFNGHSDTVPVGESLWAHDPFAGEIVDGRLYGRGASDMKSGVAAMVFAAGALARCRVPLRGGIVISVTAGEEIDSLGARAVVSSPLVSRVNRILITEPSGLDVYVAEKGAFWLRVFARGKTAHGSMPEHGVNAVEGLMDIVGSTASRVRAKWSAAVHPLLGKATVSVNTFSGGVKTNVVPDYAECTIDIRTLPGQAHDSLIAEAQAEIERVSERVPGLKAGVQVLNDRTAYEIDPSHHVVGTLVDAVRDTTGRTPAIGGVAYYTDASVFWPAKAVPIVICGPGEASMAHQPNEYVGTSRLVEASRAYAVWACRLQT